MLFFSVKFLLLFKDFIEIYIHKRNQIYLFPPLGGADLSVPSSRGRPFWGGAASGSIGDGFSIFTISVVNIGKLFFVFFVLFIKSSRLYRYKNNMIKI
jgi:hypothetical protein